MNELVAVNTELDIPEKYKHTPIGLLLEYHNLGREFEKYDSAQMLIGMCMDNRKMLNIPQNFSFIMRSGGANFRPNEFHISYAISIGGLKHFAIIGHSQCGMVNLNQRKTAFVDGLVNIAGWNNKDADKHFKESAPAFEIENETAFTLNEVIRLREKYPQIIIAPFFYKVEDNRLYLISE